MAITGNAYVVTVDITNYLTAQLRDSLTENDNGFEQLHMDNAESTVNSYLRKRFNLPIVDPELTPAIRKCALALFHENVELVTRRINDDTRLAADDCREWLRAVSEGELALENEEDQVLLTNDGNGETLMTFEDRVFTDNREEDGEDSTRDRIGINPSFTGVGTTRTS